MSEHLRTAQRSDGGRAEQARSTAVGAGLGEGGDIPGEDADDVAKGVEGGEGGDEGEDGGIVFGVTEEEKCLREERVDCEETRAGHFALSGQPQHEALEDAIRFGAVVGRKLEDIGAGARRAEQNIAGEWAQAAGHVSAEVVDDGLGGAAAAGGECRDARIGDRRRRRAGEEEARGREIEGGGVEIEEGGGLWEEKRKPRAQTTGRSLSTTSSRA